MLAKQADGAVLVRYGDTVVLATAVLADKPREGIDFFPLLVDYEERLYAVGKIPGSRFIKREGRPSEKAILAGRSIDRPIRPLFPECFRRDVQVVATVLSVDKDNPPDTTAMIGASCALHISQIPFAGPVAGVHVGLVDGEYVINPTLAQSERSRMNVIVAGTGEAIMMVEAGADEVPENDILGGILFGHEEIKRLVRFIDQIRSEVGRPKLEFTPPEIPEELAGLVRSWATARMVEAIQTNDKAGREEAIAAVKDAAHAHFSETLGEEYAVREKEIDYILDGVIKDEVRKMIAIHKIRPDGRKMDEIRPITCEVGILPRAHGSGLFTRGQTQVLTVATLGTVSESQILDGLEEEDTKRYIHHYNFPAYSVGEVRPMRGPGRREIGHGALAERALLPVIPTEEVFPYTIRLVSEVLESNGSTSQASVCGSALALMDAGVPIKKPVAGVAMGLVKYQDEVAILTDIQGMEDHLGDMDFKVAGTRDGVTAIQMDIKIKGIGKEILERALEQARKGRLYILDRMTEVIAAPRPDLSPFAPRMLTIEIDPDRIRDVIGPGGKMIRKITEETGTTIDIEDDGRVVISSVDREAGERAVEIIRRLTKDVQVGEVYLGKVVRILNFGAFVEVLPGKEGLVHISQLARERVNRVEDVVNIGDEIMVKVIEIDKQGRVNLSRKAILAEGEQAAAQKAGR
ncbi:MAG: polyribonucleotide nucleotidyltransferase [Patescibacteria group bacterium]